MADALDDEWWLETDNEINKVADETTEKEGANESSKTNTALEKKKKGIKRKANKDDSKNKTTQKSRKKRKKESSGKTHERKRITDESDEVLSKPGTAKDLAEMLSKALKDKLNASALEDLLPDAENDFYPHNIDSMEPNKYLTTILPKWKAAVKKSLFMKNNGSPVLLIITSSAVRAVDLNRQIKDFVGEKCKVAKLFAKHIKIEEQKKFLSKTNCQVGIGTPGRLLQLIKQGVLQLESLVAVVLDWNWRDAKLKRIADIPEIRQDLVNLLKDFVIESVKGSPCKLALL